MAKKNKINFNSPSLYETVMKRMTPLTDYDSLSSLPQSYGINEFDTDVVPVIEQDTFNVSTSDGSNNRSFAENLMYNAGKAIVTVLDEANPLYLATQKERLSVGLSKLQDNLMETEAKWIPQIEEAKQYVQAKQLLNYSNNEILTPEQQEAVNVVNELEPKVKEYAKHNPYIRDLFYDTDGSHVNASLAINLKALANDFTDKNILNFNPFDNIATALSDGALNKDDEDFLWNNKQQQLPDSKRIEELQKALDNANSEYDDKTSDIVKRQNTLKKGNWLFDPSKLTKEFEDKVNNTEISITDPSSWFYNLPHIGSSLSEVEMMFLQTGTSILANKAARSLAARAALTQVPYVGQAATAIAMGEQALNLWLAKYYRQSETASEVFDNYTQNVLEKTNNQQVDLGRVLESWEPKLSTLGYPVEDMTEDEVLKAGLAQGFNTDQEQFENTRKEAFNGLQMVRDVNDALSYSDYLQTMPFSYGGKLLWNAASKQFAKAKGYQQVLDEVPDIAEQIGLTKVIGRTVDKVLAKTGGDVGANITRKHLLENIGKLAKANAVNLVAESTEEGVQYNVGYKYRKGEYDYLGEGGVDPIKAAYEMGLLGYEAHLAYHGLSDDNYLNTDSELKHSMDVGGFIGLIMPMAANAGYVRNTARQYAYDKEVQKLVSKGYADAEMDNKMDVFLDAVSKGKEIGYVTDYLESMKALKQNGVTDEMIDGDKKLATDLWSQYRNKNINENLKDLGIKRGSEDHKKIVKNYLHILNRFQEADKATNDVGAALEKLFEQGKYSIATGSPNLDTTFRTLAEESYNAYVQALRDATAQEREMKLNATPEYEAEIEQEFLESLIDKELFIGAVYDIAYAKLQRDAINELNTQLQKRKKSLQQISEDTGLNIDLRNINNMREYAKQELENVNKRVSAILSKYGVKNFDATPEPVNSEEIKRNVTAYVMNKAVRDRLYAQVGAYITGKLDLKAYRDIQGHTFKDLSEEQQNELITNKQKEAADKGEPIPSRKSIIAKYNQEQSVHLAELEEMANQDRVSRISANSLFMEHLKKGAVQERIARQEKEEEGEVLPDMSNDVSTDDSITPAEAPAIEPTPTPSPEPVQTEEPTQVIRQEPTTEDKLVDELLEEEARQSAQGAKQQIIEPGSEDIVVGRNTVEEQTQRPNQEIEDIIAREETVIETVAPTPEELALEDNRAPLEEPVQETVQETTPAEVAVIEQRTETKDNSDPVPPTTQQVENSKQEKEQTSITIVDGGVYVNGTTFVSDEVLQMEQQMMEDTSVEIYGETGFANMRPETSTNDTDALSNKKTHKVKHVANTFFYRPDSTEPMGITVNGKPLKFTNASGDVVDILPGSELAKKLATPGWLEKEVNDAYYIVGNHRFGDNDVYAQAVYLIMEDKDGVYVTALRTPDYVDKEIASGNYNQEEIRQLQNQKAQLIALRQQIVNAYLGSNKQIPTQPLKTVKPAKLRISNGEFNNQKTADEAPSRRRLNEVTNLGLDTNDVRRLDRQILDAEFGYGTGGVTEFISEPFVIRQLGTDKELTETQGKGRSGAIYFIPKPEQTPNGSVAPIQLSIAKLDTGIYGGEVKLGTDGNVNSVAELAYKLLVGEYNLFGAEKDVLDIIVNNGPGTLISPEVAAKYPFLMDKMLYYNDDPANRHVQFSVKNPDGKYVKVEFDPKKATEAQKKLLIRKIAQDLHWNTDKYALREPIPERIVKMAEAYFKQYPKAKEFKIAGLDDLTFTRDDLGIGKEGGPVSLLTWMINTGKIQTDLGDTLYRAPFVYTDGVATPQITETELVSKDISTINREITPQEKARQLLLQGKLVTTSDLFSRKEGPKNSSERESERVFGNKVDVQKAIAENGIVIVKTSYENGSRIELKTPDPMDHIVQNYDANGNAIGEPFIDIGILSSELFKKYFGDDLSITDENLMKLLADTFNSSKQKDKLGIEYVSTNENWSEEQIKNWMKENTPQYKYKTGKWQVIRRNGKLQAALKVVRRGGLASQERGKGTLNVTEARKWLENTLGIDQSDVVTSEAIFRMANAPQVYGALKVCMDTLNGNSIARIYLSEQAGEGVEYHEGFHYVSNLLLNDKLRESLYQDYIKTHPELTEASKLDVEEALAEEFRSYMLNENRPSLMYRIKKAFKALKFILGLSKNGRLVNQIFKRIRKGEFSKYKPSQQVLQDFNKRFGGRLYYYVPGVDEADLKKMASIADSSTFYAVVDSLNATVMDTFNISSIEDLQSLGKKIDDIFEDILATNIELGMYDETQEQLIKDIISNKAVFKKLIDDYLRNFSIIKKNSEEAEEAEREATETGDNPDNSWDKESYTISKKANVAFKAKLFFYSIPKTRYEFDAETGQKILVEEEDDLLMTTRSEDFNVTWNKVLENLWNVESYLDMVDKCYNLGKVDPFFMTLYNKLTSKDDPIDEVTKTQILNTVKSAKNSMTAIVVEAQSAPVREVTRGSDEQIEEITKQYASKLNWRVQDSDIYRKISRTPSKWSYSFFLSDLITTNEDGSRVIDQSKFRTFVWANKIKLDALFKKKNTNLDDYNTARALFIEMLNNLSIQIDDLALDYLLTTNFGESSMNSLRKFWNGYNTSSSFVESTLKTLNLAADAGSSSIKDRSGKTARSFDRIFTSRNPKAQINQLAIAWGRTHPSPEEFSVTGADGNLVYPITENNYMSDQIRWLKYDLNGKRELLEKNPYSANSILLQGIKNNADLVKLHTYLNLEEDTQNTNRDYFGISPIEDYVSKLVFGFSNHLFCPTMSDKKTWHTISGIQMVKDFLPSTELADYVFNEGGKLTGVAYKEVQRRFSDRTLDIFKGYLRDEYNAVQKYFATKDKVKNNPNLAVGNYYGSKKGNYADGNGGRFRYFNVLTINGEKYNINEILAKAEYADDQIAIKQILQIIKDALDNNTVIRDAINTALVEYADKEVAKAIELGIINYDLTNKNLPDNLIHTPKEEKDKKKKDDEDETPSNDNSFETLFKDVDSRDKEKDIIYSIIASHAINSAISTIEIEKCFTGDPALYKWQKELMIYKPGDPTFIAQVSDKKSLKDWTEAHDTDHKSDYQAYYMITGRDVDKIKRLSSVLSTGTNLRTKWGNTKDQENRSNSKFQVLQLKDNEIGSTVYDTLYQMFRKSLIKDMFQKEFGVTDQQAINAVKDDHATESTLGRLRKKNPDAVAFIEKQAKASAKPYADGEINQADAAVYIRPEFYKRLMQSLGEWSPEIEEAYQIMEEGDGWLYNPEKYRKAIKAITQPLKMVYFGDHFDSNLGMNVNTFDKMALFPLFKSFAKADNKYLYDRMNDESKGVIDMVTFESAIKVGGRKKLEFYKDGAVNRSELDAVSDIDGTKGSGLATYTQDLTQLRLQLNTDPHEHLERSFGTQAIKIGFANVVDTRSYGENKGLSVKGSEIKKNIMDSINALSRIGQNKVRREFFTDGKVDSRKVVDYLQRQARNSGMSAEIIANLTVDENGDIQVPIEAMSIRDWIQTKVTSFINKAVVDVNTPGGSAIQMSSFAYEAVNRNVETDESLGTAFNQGKKLKFLAKEGHMEVILSENFFRDILPEELKDASFAAKRNWLLKNKIIGNDVKPYGIGYRIPTQGLSSMFSFSVADIMPTTIGDTIIVPEEFTAMTGSDFDVDKLYLATYTYENGLRVDSNKKSEKGYINKLLDMYSLVLTDFTNIAETRASIDTLTKLLQKEVLPMVKPKSTVEVQPMYELAPSFQLSRKTEYTGGKAGIAPFALNSTNHALTQFTHLCINYTNGNRYNLGALDAIKGEDDQRIMDWLSAMVNAHVDVAKDPYIMALNVNSITYNMTSLLLRGGKGDATFYFLAQPSLIRFANDMLASKGIIGAETGVTEKDKLKQLAKDYMESLKYAINRMENGNEKTLYAQYYNWLAPQYGLESMQGYDAVEVNYNDVFDKKVASYALKNPQSAAGLYQQVISLRAYRDLSQDTEVLSNLVQLSQIDTKKFGNTLPLQLNFKRRLNRYINNYQGRFYISNNDKIDKPINYYLSSTFLKLKLDAGINTPRILLGGQVIEATKGYKSIFNAACDFFLGNSSDKQTVTELSKILTTSLRTKAVVNNIEDFAISDKKFLNMLRGPKSMVKQLTYVKNILRKRNDLPALAYNGTIKNELLNYLQEYAADGEVQMYDRIVTVNNALTNSFTYENRLLSSYRDLLDCEDPTIQKFANNLGIYAYLTSFDNRSTDSFFDVITTEWKKSKGYAAVIKSAIDILNNDQLNNMDYFGFDAEKISNGNYTELFTEVARNAYMNDKIVKPYNLDKSDRNFGTLFHPEDNIKPVPVVFSSYSARNPFVKMKPSERSKKTLLYQKVAKVYQVDLEGNVVKNSSTSIYKVVPALGTKDDGKTYYEYNKMSSEQSAFESNALPKEAIWNNTQVESLIRKFFEPITKKNKTILMYESTDAITIKSTEKQELDILADTSVQNTFGSDQEVNTETVGNAEESNTITVGETVVDTQTITVGESEEITLSDMMVDSADNQTVISDNVLEITDETFGESPYFDTIFDVGITYNSIEEIIKDTSTPEETIEDMRFNDEAYKNCKGK